jgi:limonene-1,2-epoxide hydrolase
MEALDYDAALPMIASDCEYTNLPMGTVTGPDGVRSVLEPFFAPTLSNELRIVRQSAQGGTVMVERLDRHQVAPDRWAELPVVGVFEIDQGRIRVWREYFDLGTLLQQWPELQQTLGG